VDKLKEQAVATIMKEGTSMMPTGDIRSTIEGAVHLAVQKAYLITDPEVLQAERQKREEMVEAEREKVKLTAVEGYVEEKAQHTEMIMNACGSHKRHAIARVKEIDELLQALIQPNNPTNENN
jgi:hypothetical protein